MAKTSNKNKGGQMKKTGKAEKPSPHKKKQAKVSSSNISQNKKKNTKSKEGDWLSALVKQANDTNNSSENQVVLSKQERIAKRNEKKRKREERKGLDPESIPTKAKPMDSSKLTQEELQERQERSELAMYKLSNHLTHTIQSIHPETSDSKSFKHLQAILQKQDLYSAPQQKGKATKNQQLTDDIVQPRLNDYGGLGLARPSLLIDFRDVSFVPKLEQEFAEHIEGFFGKQRTKAMKRQLDGNMLWRRLAEKKDGKGTQKKGSKKTDWSYVKYQGKKLSDMTPDERVEAMIKLDMI